MPDQTKKLAEENIKLRRALAALIPWAGQAPDGPEWATPEARDKNRAMFEAALNSACSCFPPNFNSMQDIAEVSHA